MAIATLLAQAALAGDNEGRVGIGAGILCPRGLCATLSYEAEGRFHNAWELFAQGCLRRDGRRDHGKPFWKGYRTWTVGAAFKPCVVRGRNNYGSLRLGGSLGSDLDRFLGAVHLGYEHDYRLGRGWQAYWQAGADIVIVGGDVFRAVASFGFRMPARK